ncbi:cytochrome b [Ralstonia sp. 24A2]|uniref:cytochrome b n=1 Tax=Ralstonia sp. 24A2 TaxID=3447364 RepID=UPI003F696248
MSPSPERYARPSVVLHWLMFLLFAGALATIEYKGTLPKGSAGRALFTSIHMMLGQAILLFACVRVWARWRYAAPADIGATWQIAGAKLVHWVLPCPSAASCSCRPPARTSPSSRGRYPDLWQKTPI